MNNKIQEISDHQIRTEWYVKSPYELSIHDNDGGCDPEMFIEFLKDREDEEMRNFSCELIGWPNGVTIILKRPFPHQNIDVDDLVRIYNEITNPGTVKYTEISLC